ncbi:hypothetical protein MJO29_012027 [Puccinia striiformis f. sp. tritici]|nr:hypothetical protein MJO29_012027 [Puccinia striiformis f. sp. tritici]
MAKYIAEMEVSLAEMNSIQLDVSGKLISCGIIGRITDKRLTLVQTLFADLKAVAEPRRLIGKLRDICNHKAVTKRKIGEEEPIPSSSTALSTTSCKIAKRPTQNCKNGHNPNIGHSADECYFLHPEKKPEWMKKKDKASAYILTPSNPEQEQPSLTALIRPSFGYNTILTDHYETISMVLDSGASHHMLNSLAYFQKTVKTLIQITTGNDKGADKLVAIAQGDATLKFENGNTIFLKNALYVSDLSRNLISMIQLVRHKATIYNNNRRFEVKIDNGVPIQVNIDNFILEIEGIIQPKVIAMAAQIKPIIHDFMLWHNCLGHASASRIAASLSLSKKFNKLCSCLSCMEGKMTKVPFKSHFHSVSSPLEVVHGDLVGPITPAHQLSNSTPTSSNSDFTMHMTPRTTIQKL